MPVTIPNDRVGDATLLVRWQRIDPVGEGFYNCSDITIDNADPVGGDSGGGQQPYLIQGDRFIPGSIDTGSVGVGDSVEYRTLTQDGVEHSLFSIDINSQNINDWPRLLASTINGFYESNHNSDVFIGAWHESMQHYMYFSNELYGNYFNSRGEIAAGQMNLIFAEPEPTDDGLDQLSVSITPKVLQPLEPAEMMYGEVLYLEATTELADAIVSWTQISGTAVANEVSGTTLIVDTGSIVSTQLPTELIFEAMVAHSGQSDRAVMAVTVLAGDSVSEDPQDSSTETPPVFTFGSQYGDGDRVSYIGNIYVCLVGGWCSSGADWAYEPGVGLYWQQAWQLLVQSGDSTEAEADNTGGLGEDSVDQACSVSSWSASTVYVGGDQAFYDGELWEAKWWTTGEIPGTTGQWGVWKRLGACQ